MSQRETKHSKIKKIGMSADLYTPEGEFLQGQPWQSYPRPQLRREAWVNLNGTWDFTVSVSGERPEHYDASILVPYPPESLLSGLHRDCPDGTYLFYRRTFPKPEGFGNGRVLLHFGAADQVAVVYLNGRRIGEHTGGYTAFSFDITHVLREENELIVRVTDRLRDGVLPYGKQRRNRGGMWYTPVSGIWQTVWLECVPDQYIRALQIQNGENWAEITVEGDCPDGEVTVQTPAGEMVVPLVAGRARVEPAQPEQWSPEHPYLYMLTIRAGEDTVSSYFALRSLSVREIDGCRRLCLNGKPYFFHGVLDQGYWSDGLFTPAAPECYEKDILAMKSLGFNTLRKHIKIEPEQFYYDCDRLGMIVFQDMVNNGHYSFLRDTALPTIGLKRKNDRLSHPHQKTREQFLLAMEQTVRQLKNHPCVCYWTIFNEGWGQFDSTKCYHRMKELDASRFVASASGWFKGGESDIAAEHCYFKPFKPTKTDRPLVLSEFGGYSLKPAGHAFNPDKEYGYRHFEDRETFEDALVALYEEQILPAVQRGLCGAIYTQLSDVEDEVNGLLSYDRKVCKVTPARMYALADRLKTSIR